MSGETDMVLYVRLVRRRAGCNPDGPGPGGWLPISIEGPAIGLEVPMEMRAVADAVNRPSGEIESAVFRVEAHHLKRIWPVGRLPSTLAREPAGQAEPDPHERSDENDGAIDDETT